MRFNLTFLLYGASALMSFPALGQSSATTSNPTNAGARVPAIKYESAFAGYTPYREEKLAPWRDVNDDVARAGGHIGIFRGAGNADHDGAAPGPAKPAPGQPPVQGASQVAPDGHSSH
jgi:hypothetical protein